MASTESTSRNSRAKSIRKRAISVIKSIRGKKERDVTGTLVFIAYDIGDEFMQNFVQNAVEILEENGVITEWFRGTETQEQLTNKIVNSNLVIAFFTNNYIANITVPVDETQASEQNHNVIELIKTHAFDKVMPVICESPNIEIIREQQAALANGIQLLNTNFNGYFWWRDFVADINKAMTWDISADDGQTTDKFNIFVNVVILFLWNDIKYKQ